MRQKGSFIAKTGSPVEPRDLRSKDGKSPISASMLIFRFFWEVKSSLLFCGVVVLCFVFLWHGFSNDLAKDQVVLLGTIPTESFWHLSFADFVFFEILCDLMQIALSCLEFSVRIFNFFFATIEIFFGIFIFCLCLLYPPKQKG